MSECELRCGAISGRPPSNRGLSFLRLCLVLISCWGVLVSSGCFSMRIWRHRGRQLSKADPPLLSTATSDEILARVNLNAYSEYSPDGLKSYRCDDVRVRMQGVPAVMRASIVVEAPRNLRLRVSHPLSGGEAVDIGSNEEEFWFWAKDSKPENVLVCSHDKIAIASQVTSLPLPFRPDWLMEVLGVVPISGTGYEVRRTDRKNPIVELVSEQRTPDQQVVRRIIKVNMIYGVVMEHRVESTTGVLIAKALLLDHFPDPKTRLTLPRLITIDWPAAGQQLSLSLEFQTVDFNSPAESEAMWQSPQVPGYPEFNLGDYAIQQLGQTAAGLASQGGKSAKQQDQAGRATLEDLEVIEAPGVAVEGDAEMWTQEASLDVTERPIREVSSSAESALLPAEEIEQPVNILSEEETSETFPTDPRPFPNGL